MSIETHPSYVRTRMESYLWRLEHSLYKYSFIPLIIIKNKTQYYIEQLFLPLEFSKFLFS